MTPAEMETLLQKQDARWARIEQILPTLATKADLEALRQELSQELRQEFRQELTARIGASESSLRLEMRQGQNALRVELTERIETTANGLRVLIEASRDETRVLAEHVLDLVTRFPRQS